MPNWKKLIVSGSDAHLNSLDAKTFISASEFVGGDFIGDGSQLTNVTASYLSNELTASISGSITEFSSSIVQRVVELELTGSDHESRLDTAEGSISSLNAATSSYALQSDISGAFAADSSSFEQRITVNEGSINSLNSATSSYLLNTTDTLDGDLTVTGKITAQEFHTEFVSASIIYQSGSTKFGDTADDVHSFTGSVNISGSISADNLVGIISSSAQIADEISGSFTSLSSSFEQRITTNEGDIATLTSQTSSYALEANISGAFTSVSQSIASDIEDIIDGTTTVTSASYALTASYALNAGGGTGVGFPFSGSAIITGSLYVSQSYISGSFIGDGSGIEGVVSSSYALTASYALNAGGADTGSLLATASAAGSTITFEKGDGSTFDVTISSEVTPANALVTASLAGSTLTFEKGDSSTFDIILPSGGGGYSGESATAHHTQSIAAETWSFAHNLGDRLPVVTVYDSTYDIIIPNEINAVDSNNLSIVFSTPRTGYATAVIVGASSSFASTASYVQSINVDGPLGMDSITSASYALTASYGENFVISGSIDLNGYTWPTQDGVYGVEVLTTDGAGNLTFEIPTNVYETVKNVSGEPLLKGTPVHATGSNTSGNLVGVIPADALDPTRMPATYILASNLADGEEGLGIAVGFINGVDTRGLIEGEPVYVAAGGGWTQTKPTGSALIQNLGIVTKVAENGSGVVLGAGRSNDVPNIQQGYAWVGNGDQVATATPTASFFVTSGSHALNADDAISASYAANAELLDGLNSSQFLRNDQSGTLTGDLTVTGIITAQEFHTEFVSASIIYQSGSTQFGNSADDTHVFTGSILVDGSITGSINPTGHLLPSVTNIYDLGSPSQQWRDLYLSSASLYVDGVKIISSDANVLTFTTDNGQSIKILEQGSDDITLQTENGNIELKGTVEITSGKKIIDSAGTVIQFGDSLGVSGSITLSGTVDGIDLQAFSSSIEQRATDLEAFSSSLDATFATDVDLNLVSSSVDALNAATSSYALEANISGAFTSVSESIASDIAEIIDGTQTVTSASYALTASYALNVPVTASYALTASYIDPAFISASAAEAGFGAGGGGGTGDGFPYEGDAVITGSLFVSGGLISGSFAGDGSQLTGIDVSSVSTVSQTFTSQTSVVVSHNFNSKDINVAVYNGSDQYIIPDTITLTDANTATVTFAVPTSGRVVVVKGGHIVTALGLTSKAGSVATSSFSATGSSFYYDVTFESSFQSANYSVALQAHSQYAVPESFPGHAWVDSNQTAAGFRIVVPSFDDTTDEIHWSAIAHGESDVTASNASTASYVEFDNIANKPTLISSSLQFNTLDTPFTGSFTGSFYGDGSNLSGVTSYTDADTLSFIQGYSGSYSGSFIGDGSQLSGVTSYTDADTLEYINSLQVLSGSIQNLSGSFSGSFFGDGTGLTGLGYGDTKKLNQTVAATTWSFSHNMNEQYPTVTVYNTNNEVVQPSKIEAQDAQTLKLYFGIPTAGTAVAVVGGVALTQEAGFNRVFSQGVAATTWSFEHNLGNKYPQVIVYDSNDDLVIPGRIQVEDQNNLKIYFDTPQAGTATATVGGTSLTASYANTLVVTDTLLSSQQNTDVDTGTETVATVSTSFYDGAFFDYIIKDGTNYRAGTVMAVWDGTSVQYADNSTADIGDTSGVTLSVDINGTDARLRAAVTSDNWNIKAFVRAL